QSIRNQMGTILKKTFTHLLDTTVDRGSVAETTIDQLDQKINKTETLIRFQHDESKYHPLVGKEKRQYVKAESQLTWLRMLHYHLDNLNRTPIHKASWTTSERDLIMAA